MKWDKKSFVCTCNAQQPFRILRGRCARYQGYCELSAQLPCLQTREQYSVSKESREKYENFCIIIFFFLNKRIRLYWLRLFKQSEGKKEIDRLHLYTHCKEQRIYSFEEEREQANI